MGSPDELKSKWIQRFVYGKYFPDHHLPTLEVNIETKKIHVNGNNIKLIIVDSPSDVFFERIKPSYLRGAQVEGNIVKLILVATSFRRSD